MNRDGQKDEGTVLTQTEQENHPFDKMDLELNIDWTAQLFVYETEKSITSTTLNFIQKNFYPKSAEQLKQLSMLKTFLLLYTDEDFAKTFNSKKILSFSVSPSFLNMELNTSEKEVKKKLG